MGEGKNPPCQPLVALENERNEGRRKLYVHESGEVQIGEKKKDGAHMEQDDG